MRTSRALPMAGNLAWASLPAIEEVEVLDRFNGVPTLGIMKAGSQRTLFWRVIGYVSDFSAWLYLPLDEAMSHTLDAEDAQDPLVGLVIESSSERNACLGVAAENRLIFEREWVIPKGLARDSFIPEVARFLSEAMGVAMQHELPATRRQAMEGASRAVKELVRC